MSRFYAVRLFVYLLVAIMCVSIYVSAATLPTTVPPTPTLPPFCEKTNNGIEICDNLDNNCDGTIDEGLKTTYYRDVDGDSYGTSALTTQNCTKPPGYSTVNTDCNDGNVSAWKLLSGYLDVDNDGCTVGSVLSICSGNSLPTGYKSARGTTDCNDNNNAFCAVCTTVNCYRDTDGDSFGLTSDMTVVTGSTCPSGRVTTSGDCNDGNVSAWQLLSGYVDADNDGCTVGNLLSICSGATLPTGYKSVKGTTDCNDNNNAFCAVCTTVNCYRDTDGDSFGLTSDMTVVTGSTCPSGRVTTSGDCNDGNVSAWQLLSGYVDADNDGCTVGNLLSICSGATLPTGYKSARGTTDCNDNNNAFCAVCTTVNCYRDTDGDSYGLTSDMTVVTGSTCPSGRVTTSGDCNDGNVSVYRMINGYSDQDLDTYTLNTATQVCSGAALPSGWKSSATTIDCNDAVATIHPGATETCNDVDDNCVGGIDEGLTQVTYCGVGECAGNTGIKTCTLGVWGGDTCNPYARATTETCNGKDDNCNNQTDEIGCACTNGAIQSCGSSVGVCVPGSRTCVNGAWGACTGGVSATPEVCDGKDNNCDGNYDENWQSYSARPLNDNKAGECSGSKKQCLNGMWQNWYDSSNIPNYVPVESSTLNCDGRDNDCDGIPDEGCICTNGATKSCGSDVGACGPGTQTCVNGAWSSTCVGEVAPQTEACDTVDNDCDGSVNELLPSQNLGSFCPTNLLGVCSAGTHYQYCNANVSTYSWSACVQTTLASPEVCDGLDNDCDGQMDNGLTRPSRLCNVGIGACQSTGTEYQTCLGIAGWSMTYNGCTATQGTPGVETCNGLDDNCDNSIDNGLTPPSQACTVGDGACQRTGTTYKTCNGFSGWSMTYGNCSVTPGTPTAETCNNIDDNCNGIIDEGCSCSSGATRPCGSNVGICVPGTQTCVNGVWSSTCVGQVVSQQEVCDALDNDCDGTINDLLPPQNLNTSCSTSLSGVCSAGKMYKYCDASVNAYTWTSCSQITSPSPEICDAFDNDCDGTVNNGLTNTNITYPCTTGLSGVCSIGTHYEYCDASVDSYKWGVCTQKINSSTEICDGLDNDCDGTVDEGCGCIVGTNQTCGSDVGACVSGNQTCVDGVWSAACIGEVTPQPEICDGLDNDCDGNVNELLPVLSPNTACSTGLPGICAAGTMYQYCNANVSTYTWTNCSQTTLTSTEICDGLDNDCDGTIDENICVVPGGSGGSDSSSGSSGSTINNSNNGVNTNPAGANTNSGATNPNVEFPSNLNPNIQYAQAETSTPPIEDVKDFSKRNRIIIVFAILIVIGGVLAFVFIERYRDSQEEVVPDTSAANNTRVQPPNIQKTNTYSASGYGVSPTGSTIAMNTAASMVNRDAPAMSYVFAMRQKGFKDDVIISNLRSKGWSEDLLRRLFK